MVLRRPYWAFLQQHPRIAASFFCSVHPIEVIGKGSVEISVVPFSHLHKLTWVFIFYIVIVYFLPSIFDYASKYYAHK